MGVDKQSQNRWNQLMDRESFNRLSHDQLHDIFALLLQRIEDLEQRVNQNSSNSSKPPSSDPPGTGSRGKKKRTGRNPGGQPGHKANFRTPFFQERVDKFEPVVPKSCGHCQAPLKGLEKNPRRHQVAEIPPIQAWVTEYVLHALKCGECGKTTRAKLPQGASPKLMGPHLSAVTTLLSGCFRLSKREVQALLKALFNVEVSLGAVSDCEKEVSEALETAVDEAIAYAQAQPMANMDETGWKERRKLAWLWTLAT